MDIEPVIKIALGAGGYIVEASCPTGEVDPELGEVWVTRIHVFTDRRSLARFVLRALTASEKDEDAERAVEKIEKELKRK